MAPKDKAGAWLRPATPRGARGTTYTQSQRGGKARAQSSPPAPTGHSGLTLGTVGGVDRGGYDGRTPLASRRLDTRNVSQTLPRAPP